MRKFALLLAAALMVSAPLVATMTTDSYAAAKKAKKAAKAAPAPKDTGPQPPFGQITGALGELSYQLSTYRYDPNAPAKGGKKK
jgi:hypothetical protein